MTAIQILLVGFAVFAMSRVLLRLRRGDLPPLHLVIWFVFWTAVVVVVLAPGTSNRLAGLLGVGRGADVVMYLALVVLFYVVFRIFGKLEALERQITSVVRAAALRDLERDPRAAVTSAKGAAPAPSAPPAGGSPPGSTARP
jgi:hypothetical protein